MLTSVVLEPSQVPAHLQRIDGYSGRQFKVVPSETVTIPADAGLWDGGSRSLYVAIRLTDGAGVEMPGQHASPWDNGRTSRKVPLQPGFAVVEHRIARGQDMGLTFYLHPSDAVPMLPAPVDLSPMESLVLDYTCGRKSSYMGKDRCDMAREDIGESLRYGYSKPCGIDWKAVPTRQEWDAAKASLIERGMLNKAGAVTPKGRNARGSI